ncbi:MAG TPA: Bax inhibitor-1/YccA family protein [Clostridiales bacterium]|nr:Bax inhibitor-1/YccA family protein [Clostridiales bacterium]
MQYVNGNPQGFNQPSYNINGVQSTGFERTQEGFAKYIAKTYLWMFVGLAISFGIGFYMTMSSGNYAAFMQNNFGLYMAAMVGEIILILVLSLAVRKLPATVAKVLFLVYSALFGVSLAPILMMYEMGSVITVLGMTSLIYLILAVVGLKSKKDMSKLGNILFVGLLGLCVYSILSIFLFRSTLNNTIIGVVGLAIFMGFTVYDSNRIKKYYFSYQGSPEALEKTSICSALQLYLDYVNMFLRILALFGKRSN